MSVTSARVLPARGSAYTPNLATHGDASSFYGPEHASILGSDTCREGGAVLGRVKGQITRSSY